MAGILAKNIWFAVILNLLLYGLGYVYLGRRKTFGILLFAGHIAFAFALIIAVIFPFPQSATNYVNNNSIGFGIVSLAFAYDAYRLGKEVER